MAHADFIYQRRVRALMVLESIYRHGAYSQRYLALHLAAPLLEERERFLQHIEQEGATRLTLRRVAQGLIKTIRCLGLRNLRDVPLAEVDRALARWQRGRRAGWTPDFFWIAKRWLRFHHKLRLPARTREPYAAHIDEYTHFLTNSGFASETVRNRRMTAKLFLRWLFEQDRRLRSVSINDVDKFFSFKKATKAWTLRTIATQTAGLRAFFRYAENRRWCCRRVAMGMTGPRIPRYGNKPHPPTWREVRQLLAIRSPRAAEIRANAIFSLLARYGLRSGDVINLRLADFNWKAKTLNVRRSKTGGFQRFPIDRGTAASVLRYVMNVRPNCSYPHVFVTLNPPFRPLSATTLWLITSRRFKRLGIHCRPRGPHSFRYACAQHLLQRGLSFKEISDFLGHHNLETVRVYAKCDMKSLRAVADFDLGDLI